MRGRGQPAPRSLARFCPSEIAGQVALGQSGLLSLNLGFFSREPAVAVVRLRNRFVVEHSVEILYGDVQDRSETLGRETSVLDPPVQG